MLGLLGRGVAMLISVGQMAGRLPRKLSRHWLRTAAAIAAMAVTTPVCAADEIWPSAKHSATTSISWDAAARQLMNLGQLDQALSLLNARLAVSPTDVQALFLKGMIASAKKDNR